MLLRRMMTLLLVAMAIMPAVLLANPVAIAAQSAEDEQAFHDYVASVEGMTPVAGPIDGDLVLSSGGPNAASLGVNLTDFVAQVSIAVPPAPDAGLWAVALAFRQSGSAFHYFVLWSDGTWSFAPANGGPVATGAGVVMPAPGELLQLNVVAMADTAYAGIGADFLTTLDLSTLLDPGDITLSASLIGAAGATGTVGFEEFSVWDLQGVAIVPASATPAPASPAPATPAPEATATATGAAPSPPVDDETIFNNYLAESLSRPILYGPENGTIEHQPDAVSFHATGVTAADFIARVECSGGITSADGYWDCGFVFRGGAADHYRVAYVSDGYWFISQGAAQPFMTGTDGPVSASADSKVVVNLIAVGDKGYFGLNDEYIATFDLSAVQDPGEIDLASAFFADTYIENGGVQFEDLIIWSLDEGGVAPSPTAGSAQVTATVEASATVSPEQTPSPVSALPGVTGNIFASPTFGYSLTWPATWTVTNANVSPAMDILELGNGVVQADLIGETWDLAAGSCFDRIVQFYQADSAYSDIQSAIDNVSVVPGVWEITGILTMTFTDESGTATTYVDYAACSEIPGQGAIVSLEQFVPISDFATQSAAMDELRAGFSISGGAVVPAETPVAAPSPTTGTAVEPTPTTGFESATSTATAPAAETPTAVAGQGGSNVVGNTYTSPTFGYSLTWDDTWSVVADESGEGIDFLRISNGTLVADLYAAAGSNTPLECIDELFNYYLNDDLYANVVYATGPDGQPLLQDFGTYATGVISYTQTLNSGGTIDQFSEAICYRMEDQGAVVILEIYMSPADYVLQRSAISALQSGLVIPGQPVVVATEVAQTPVVQETAEPAGTVVAPPSDGGTGTATFMLQPLNNSGVTGTGTLEAQPRLVIVTAIVIGAQPGDTITIQRGSCSTMTPGAEPDYIVGELDETGLMREEVRVRLAALVGSGPFAVVVYAGGEDFSQAIACGDIS